MIKRFRKDGILYSFYLWDKEDHSGYLDVITLVITTDDNEQIVSIPVRDCDGYRVRINKKSCSAGGGAKGLFCFIGDCIDSNFMMDWVYKIIHNFSGVEL